MFVSTWNGISSKWMALRLESELLKDFLSSLVNFWITLLTYVILTFFVFLVLWLTWAWWRLDIVSILTLLVIKIFRLFSIDYSIIWKDVSYFRICIIALLLLAINLTFIFSLWIKINFLWINCFIIQISFTLLNILRVLFLLLVFITYWTVIQK